MSSYSLERENKINLAVDLLLNDFSFVSTTQQFASQDNFYVYNDSSNIYERNSEMFIVEKLDEAVSQCPITLAINVMRLIAFNNIHQLNNLTQT